jgi:MoxR-like ATPase
VVNYPNREEMLTIVDRTIQKEDVRVEPVADRQQLLEVRSVCRDVLAASHVQDFAVDLVLATQPDSPQAHELAKKYVRYGSSPRGAQALVECGRVLALMRGRVHLSTDDIKHVALSVLRHRIILNFDAHADGQTPDTILAELIRSVAAKAVAA